MLDPAGAGANLASGGRARTDGPRPRGIGGKRWVVCALLFFATTINYMDRTVLSFLAPTLTEELGWSESAYGWISSAFTGGYALGLLMMGWVMDRLGTRRGFALAVAGWSLAGMLHALVRSAWGFGFARFGLAFAEGGNFPGAIKTVAQWFPKKERALATGIFNAGANVGLLIVPLIVPPIVLWWGWQWAFILTGATGFIWLAAWLVFYRSPEDHPSVTPEELAYIRSDPPEPTARIPYRRLIPHRQTWAFAVGKFMTDPVWWVVAIFWAAKYLDSKYGLNINELALPLVIIYLAADVGSIGGGWISSALIKRGWTVNAARKTAMLICGASVLPLLAAPSINNMWLTVSLLALTSAAHQGFSANLFTLVSDMFPRQAVGSVVGFGGMWGAISGFLAAIATGYLLEWTGSYTPILYAAACTYLVTLLLIHLLVPRLEPANVDGGPAGAESAAF